MLNPTVELGRSQASSVGPLLVVRVANARATLEIGCPHTVLSKSTSKAIHHKARLFVVIPAHTGVTVVQCGTVVPLHSSQTSARWFSITSQNACEQLAYLGSDVILRLRLFFGLRAVIYFSRRPTVRTHNCRGLSAELEDSFVLPLTSLTACALPFNTIAHALATKLSVGNQSLV
jgi:hypothetical protein